MQFYPWRTDYDNYCAWEQKRRNPYNNSEEEFYRKRLQEFNQFKMLPWRLDAEHRWMQAGRPYYNVHSQLVSKLARIDLSKIPANLIELPNRLPAVNIRFSQSHPELTLRSDLETVSAALQPQHIPVNSFVHGVLFADMRPIGQNSMYFVVDFDVHQQYGDQKHPCYGVFPVALEGSVADAVNQTARIVAQSNDYIRVATNCLRVAITIGFMANSKSELIEPDVLSKLRRDFDDGDEQRKKIIVEKSRRKGKIGWNVGNDLMFLGRQAPRTSSSSENTGKELSWAHIRDGHPKAVRYGQKHSLVKIMWIRPTVVRPDLPFKQS